MGSPLVKNPVQKKAPPAKRKAAAPPPKVLNLQKGDILFKEGDRSRAMYILQEGSLRLFKKKGAGCIELAVIHHGEVIGEMAFFDGEPRSASAEALAPCKLLVISFEQMSLSLTRLPSWLSSLIQSVVKRLRVTSTKVKQLENAGVQYYSGSKAATYQYMALSEVLRFLAALLLSASRYGKDNGRGEKTVSPNTFQLIAVNMFGAPLSKLMDFLDVLQEEDFVRLEKQDNQFTIVIQHVEFIDSAMHYVHNQNTKEDNKKTKISIPCMKLLRAVYGATNGKKPDEKGLCEISLKVAVKKMYGPAQVDSLVINENWGPIVKAGWATALTASKDGTDVITKVNLEEFRKRVPAVALIIAVEELNEKKRENAA